MDSDSGWDWRLMSLGVALVNVSRYMVRDKMIDGATKSGNFLNQTGLVTFADATRSVTYC
jgi:hypothetical protein